MAEIKFDDTFHNRIQGLRTAESKLNSVQRKIDGSERDHLPTLDMYEVQRGVITLVLKAYKDLLQKDANDLEELMEVVNAADQNIASVIRKA